MIKYSHKVFIMMVDFDTTMIEHIRREHNIRLLLILKVNKYKEEEPTSFSNIANNIHTLMSTKSISASRF